jgi:carboxymethylenebutenolidase
MKKLFLLALAFAWSCQNTPTQELASHEACHATPKDQAVASFAALANDVQFVQSHDEPLPYSHQQAAGKMITFKTNDGATGKAYLLKAKKATNRYLFVIHEWWGLNEHIKKEADALFQSLEDVNVMALDLYDGKLATNAEDAGKYMQSVKAERATAIIEGAIAYAGKSPKIYTIGWCFGGGWSLQASLIARDKAAGCVIYYGMPEKNTERLATLQTDVLGIFASREKWISPEVVAEFEANMQKAGKRLTVKSFDAEHAFANPSNPNFDKAASEEANKMAIEFLKARM